MWAKCVQAIGLAPTLLDLKEAGMDISKVKMIGFNSSEKNTQKPSPQKQAPHPNAPSQSASPKAATPSSNQSPAPGSATTQAQAPAFVKETKEFNGNLQEYRKGVAANKAKSPYRVLTVKGTAFFLFHNTEMAVNGKEKLRLFDILDAAAPSAHKPLVHFSADSSLKSGTNEVRWNITQFFMIDRFEWMPDGTPVLRRDPPGNFAGAMNPEISDEDIPPEMW
jgi:hypothetical protein